MEYDFSAFSPLFLKSSLSSVRTFSVDLMPRILTYPQDSPYLQLQCNKTRKIFKIDNQLMFNGSVVVNYFLDMVQKVLIHNDTVYKSIVK